MVERLQRQLQQLADLSTRPNLENQFDEQYEILLGQLSAGLRALQSLGRLQIAYRLGRTGAAARMN